MPSHRLCTLSPPPPRLALRTGADLKVAQVAQHATAQAALDSAWGGASPPGMQRGISSRGDPSGRPRPAVPGSVPFKLSNMQPSGHDRRQAAAGTPGQALARPLLPPLPAAKAQLDNTAQLARRIQVGAPPGRRAAWARSFRMWAPLDALAILPFTTCL